MRWKKYIIETSENNEDFICGALINAGIMNFEVEDKRGITPEEKEAMHIDIEPELVDDGRVKIIFYMEMDTSPLIEVVTLNQVREAINELSSVIDTEDVHISEDVTDEKDWINNWKEYFKPFKVGNILIKPSWENIEDTEGAEMIIEIDPGTAFGTGLHETTRLCINMLQKYVYKDTALLDVGCGSGILSIIAAKMGANPVVGIDIDEIATEASGENAVRNGVKDIKWITGDMINGKATAMAVGYDAYDVVVANILADVIIPLSKVIPKHMKSGGIFITSGIINTKKDEVLKELTGNEAFELEEIAEDGDWVSIVVRKK